MRAQVFAVITLAFGVLWSVGVNAQQVESDIHAAHGSPCGPQPKPDLTLSPKQTKDEITKQTQPSVPLGARVEGCVVFEIHIDGTGIVQCLAALRGHPLLLAPALNAVKDWEFKKTGKIRKGTLVVCYRNGWTVGSEVQK